MVTSITVLYEVTCSFHGIHHDVFSKVSRRLIYVNLLTEDKMGDFDLDFDSGEFCYQVSFAVSFN